MPLNDSNKTDIYDNTVVTTPETVYYNVPLTNGTVENMAVNGSTVNQNFRHSPSSGIWYLESLNLLIADDATYQLNGVGAVSTPLTNGIQINIQSKGVVYQIANLQSNIHIFNTFPHEKLAIEKSGVLGTSSTLCGVMLLHNRLTIDSSYGDYIEVKIRDNLTTLTELRVSAELWSVQQ